MANSCLVVGCGYLGERVAALWRAAGQRVSVVTRSAERAETLRASGYEPVVADITRIETLVNLPEADVVLFAVGHDRAAGIPIEQVYVDGLRNVLAALPSVPQRFVYISSTGVYGQVDAQWVTEASACEPARAGGRACLAAETLLQASRVGPQAMLLRLAGIYGPGRIPRVADIRAGVPIAAPPDGYVNLIHVEDAARIVVAVAEKLTPPQLYNVSDGHPVQRSDYYAELARLVDAPPPTFTPPPAEAHVAQRAGSDKRISSAKLFADLPLKLQYPSYREGLAAIVSQAKRES
jgi:nucleoside-diphosphate-sugar epimerase